MKTQALRQAFLDYFKSKDHLIVKSSSLVPINDPTLLFTNAGMVQFKEAFLGLEKPKSPRATSCQKCVRAGGKHNDLENVGYTARHHTFFEMLGNFSFGDYFKREAIHYAWDFVTNVLKIPRERLWITVFREDDEAADIWLKEIKVDPNCFSRCDEKDNFWSMGDTGPCGPCTEIFYDHGPSIPGGPPGSLEEDGDRYIEIWNLVFMQYNRSEDGSLTPLPAPSVDTGMGFERVAAIMQGVHSNYEIDIFQHLIQFIAKLGNIQSLENKSLRVIADHIRSCAFLIADGVIPSNEGRGYVLRRIARRAIRHGYRLGLETPFFYKLLQPLVESMGQAYPELIERKDVIENILQQEELQFARTLEQGLKILEQDIQKIKGKTISGETVFRLYDTYGFPVDLTADIARERDLQVDMDGFNEAMVRQKTRARESSQFSIQTTDRVDITHVTDFTGYEKLEEESIVVALLKEGKPVRKLSIGDTGLVVLDHTPFYAEAGGQVGDQGVLYFEDGEFQVDNTKKFQQAHVHFGKVLSGTLSENDKVRASVDREKRLKTQLNHSATHLLHAALRQILGKHVQQKGSLVEPERLRFDFSHSEPLTREQIQTVEHKVNEQIRLNSEVQTDLMAADKALESGAMALFGEKYGEQVRVLRMGGEFSVELCGGTHVERTGDIGYFKITGESGIASGVRRIEAVTGAAAEIMVEKLQAKIDNLASSLKCHPDILEERLQSLISKNKQLEKEAQQLKFKMLSGATAGSGDLIPRDINGIQVLAADIPGNDAKGLREFIDKLKNQYKQGVFVLASHDDQKVTLIAGVTQNCIDKFNLNANELVKQAAKYISGQGGGRPDLAQAGGSNVSGLKDALDNVYRYVEEQVKGTSAHPPTENKDKKIKGSM